MCGIAGYFSLNNFFNRIDIQLMLNLLAHRGPDAEGVFEDDFVALGHRRLSIIDLSFQANQPMYSSNGRYVMVYNGEVYNYLELAAVDNLQLKTTSDSEVILELFSKYGIKAIEKFNGMFAIAIYDNYLKQLYLFRDRVGIKPLYYYSDGNSIAFASELKALKAIDKLNVQVNHDAIFSFLHLGYIPAPQSIYKQVYKLKAGHWLKISKTGITEDCYWQPENEIKNETLTNESIAFNTLDQMLNSSVRLQMRSDVPLGVFLSGGTDSSMVAALATKNSPNTINTFSIGFKEKLHNESEYAKAIAGFLKTNHYEFIATYEDALQLISKVMLNFDEPFSDSSAIPTFLVSQLASKHVKVVLSGDGGDELFFGYGTHQWAEKINAPYFKFGKPITAFAFSNMSARYKRVAKLLNYDSNTFMPSHIFSQENILFSGNEISELLSFDFLKSWSENYFNFLIKSDSVKRKLTTIEQQALFDLNYYLPDDLLVKVDRTSMQHGIEARVPLLDHHIVEFALNLHPDLKIKKNVAKYLLKQVLYQYIPKHLLDRPKQGFSIPLNSWLYKELYYLIEENLSENAISDVGVLNFHTVQKLIKEWKSGSDFLYNRIWQLIVLQQWYMKNF